MLGDIFKISHLPPLAEQGRIADALGRFGALAAAITRGLPAEIAER